jgi:hypothetical protein
MNVRTQLHAGQCFGDIQNGTIIDDSQGSGYYGAVRGDSGSKYYINAAYTTFMPDNQPIYYGERVEFSIIPPGYYQAGKVACVAPETAPAAG